MSNATKNTLKTYKYTRKCLLHEIKKCDVVIHTNRINQKFCCDDHRYQWHNNVRALFRRMTLLEIAFIDTRDNLTKAFSDLAAIMVESFGDPLEKIAEFLEERKNG